jgi:surface antigen
MNGPSTPSSTVKSASRNKLFRDTSKYMQRNRKRVVRYGLLAGNIAIVVAAVVMVVIHSNGTNTASYSALSTATENKDSNPLDTLSATDIAANVAIMARLPETGLIINEADSVNADLTAAVTSREAVQKPQILSSAIKTKADIKDHVVAQGDTLASLAVTYGVTSDSIKWSNNLTVNTLKVGATLVIPPINGIAYTVKSGDSPAELGKKYNVPAEQIVQFNDAEISGLVVGERIVIPGGTVKAVSTGNSSRPFYANFAFGNSAIYGYNGYVPGYCTWYVANKRIQIGRPLPANLGNAATWDNYAPQGWDRTPRPGAAVVTAERGAGHVAFVEQVYEDGSVLVSEMNRRRRYEVTTRVFSPAEAVSYKYIN